VYLAHVNRSQLKVPVDHPSFLSFGLGARIVNRAAAHAPGHVWSEQDVEGDHFLTRSVWTSPDTLIDFVYAGVHRKYMKRRAQWFLAPTAANVALWWVEEGHRPSVPEAHEKLALLIRSGPSEVAFGFDDLRNTGC